MTSVKLLFCVLALVCAVVLPFASGYQVPPRVQRRWIGLGGWKDVVGFGETDGDDSYEEVGTTTVEPDVTTTAELRETTPTEPWGNFKETVDNIDVSGLATVEPEVTPTEDDDDGSGTDDDGEGSGGDDDLATVEPEVTTKAQPPRETTKAQPPRETTKAQPLRKTTKAQPPRETTTTKLTDSLFKGLAETSSTVDCIKKCIRQDKTGLSEFLNVIDNAWAVPTEWNNGNFVDNNVEKPTTPRCPPVTTTKQPIQQPPNSCKELLERDKFLPNGPYKLQNEETLEVYRAYCHMTEIPECGPGGWTLAMKIDGKKNFFNYDSQYWTNEEPYAVRDGLEGLTDKQTKLASYWNTPFKKICLGMKRNNVTKWTAVDYEASSLYNVIAGESYVRTHAGREAWASLISDSNLQDNCDKEGFNIHRGFYWGSYGYLYMNVRLGLVANNENDCLTPDSCIGFGTSIRGCNDDLRRSTCGNFAVCGWIDNRDYTAFGYILVQ